MHHHHRKQPEIQYPCSYFWLIFQNKCQFLRIQINPDFYTSIGQLKQHLSNHFSLNELPNLYLISEFGKYTKIDDEKTIQKKVNDLIPENSFIIVEPIGMTAESVFPKFAASLVKSENKNETPKLCLSPENISVVKKMFSNWDQLLEIIHNMNTPNENEDRKSQKKDDGNDDSDRRKIFTVQSLFTETGSFSDLFLDVAKKMKIKIPTDSKPNSPKRLKKKSSL